MKRYDYIELYDWMRVVYDLTGYELLVYAYIYNQVEVTPIELEMFIGHKAFTQRALKSLEDGGLILWKHIENENGEKLPKDRSILFYANPEFCL